MADISNPQAVFFVNNRIRRMADHLAQAYFEAKQVKAIYTGEGIGDLLGATGSDKILDGSHSTAASPDGRPPITVFNVNTIMARIDEVIADYEANTNLKLNQTLLVSPNPSPV